MFAARATTDPTAAPPTPPAPLDQLLADVTRSSRDGIAVVVDSRIEWINGPLVVLLGLPADELVGRALHELVLEVLDPGGAGASLDLTALGDGDVVTGNLVPSSGPPVPVSVEAAPLGAPGEGRRAITIRRITPLLRAQAEARVAEARFEAVSTFAPVGVFHSEHGVRVDFVNLRFAELWNARPEELTGTGWLGRVHPDDLPGVFATLERTLAGTASDCTLRVAGAPTRHVRLRAVPVVRPDRSMGFVGSVEEIDDPADADRARDVRTGLRSALDARDLGLAYQPIVHTGTGRTVGAEALLRYRHPVHGEVPATEAVAVAEASGDILELGRQVVAVACRDLAVWRHRRLPVPSYVAVNVSALQLEDPGFGAFVVRALEAHDLSGGDLCLELTETQAMADPDGAVPVLTDLRRHGIRIALDDFGVGHSSLAHLRNLPVDLVKLDRSYVRAIEDRAAAAVVSAVTSLAGVLGCEVVAEGIETAAQLRWARDLGCTFAQGYALGRPVPFADFTLELP